jgi:hypothetical protein
MNVIEIYVKKVESVLNRFLSKKYDWFDRIELKGIGYNPGLSSHVAFEGTIFVDSTWLYKQWREYHYETPFPDLKDDDLNISFGDFIGGNFSKKLKDEFIMIFTSVTLVPKPEYISWSWIKVETVEKQNEDDNENDLRENIKKILKRESKKILFENSNIPPALRRRLNLSKDFLEHKIKEEILKRYKPGIKSAVIINTFSSIPSDIIWDSGLYEELTSEQRKNFHIELKNHLYNNFEIFANEYYDKVFENDDVKTYVFVKQSEMNGGRGFTEAVEGWNNFLTKFGYWFPDLDWNDVKQKLDSRPLGTKLLIKKPLEGHIYHYYFFVIKK